MERGGEATGRHGNGLLKSGSNGQAMVFGWIALLPDRCARLYPLEGKVLRLMSSPDSPSVLAFDDIRSLEACVLMSL